jgi:hypothetical protein
VKQNQHYSEFAKRTIRLLDGRIMEARAENAKAV